MHKQATASLGVSPMPSNSARTLVRRMMRPQHFVDAHRAMDANIAVTRDAYLSATAGGAIEEAGVLNVSLFAVLYNYDIACLLEDLEVPASDWHERLNARVLALTVYECFEDMQQLMGKEFREIVARWQAPDPWVGRLNSLGRGLRGLKREHDAWLREVRLNAIAHRSHKAIAQLRFIGGLELERLQAAGGGLLEWTTSQHQLMSDLIAHRAAARKRLREEDTALGAK